MRADDREQVIGAYACRPYAPGQREGRHDDKPPAELPPFSHERNFSVNPRSAPGYRIQAVDEVIVIGGNGQIVAVEYPEVPAGVRRRKGEIPVPLAAVSRRHAPLRFLWGPGRHVFGLSECSLGARDDALAVDDQRKYEALHREILEGVGDIALQAFLRFLERNVAGMTDEFPTIVERLGSNLAFRFHYDEHYLHERHAAQLAWKRFLVEHAAVLEPRASLEAAGNSGAPLQLCARGLEDFLRERR